jgi:plasmid stability protein
MATLIVREVEDRLHARLKREAQRRGISVNTLTKELLARGVGQAPAAGAPARYTELDDLAGTWTAADERRFKQAVKPMAEVDPELWR